MTSSRHWVQTFEIISYQRWCYDYNFPSDEDVRKVGRVYTKRKVIKKIGVHWACHFDRRIKEPLYHESATFHPGYGHSSFLTNSLYIAVHGYLRQGEETLFRYSHIYEERKNKKRLQYEFVRHTYAEFGVRVKR